MRPCHIRLATVALVLAFSASACAGIDSGSATDTTSDRNQPGQSSFVSANDFDPSDFED